MKAKQVVTALVLALCLSLAAGLALAEGDPGVEPDTPELVILQKVVLVFIQIAIPPTVAFVLNEWKRQRAELRKHRLWLAVERAAMNAVAAAEQLGLTGDIADYADSKLEYALDAAENFLALQGIRVDVDPWGETLRALIEAEVNRQFPPNADAA